jgi:tetratricopeptide (TPR) repeat protein
MLGVFRFGVVLVLASATCVGQSANQSSGTPGEPLPQTATPGKAVEGTVPSSDGKAAAAPSAPNLLDEATSLYRKGDFNGALAKYQEVLQQQPKSADAYAGLVRVYLKQRNIEQASQIAEKGMSEANSPRMRVARGELWFRQGKITDAEREWVEVIKSGDPDARAYFGLARVRHAIAMYKSAKRLIDKAHELDPNDPDISAQWVRSLPRAERVPPASNEGNATEPQPPKASQSALQDPLKSKSGACRLVSKVGPTETTLVRLKRDPEHLRGYGLSVEINGHKTSLMLDTGAGGILVKRSIAERAGISKVVATQIGGIGDRGDKSGFVGVADSIKIGELEFQNCFVAVEESYSVVGEDGLIGADVFEHFLVDIDFPHEKLKLSELPKRPGESGENLALKSADDDSDDSGEQDSTAAGDAKSAAAAVPPSGPQDRYIAPEMQSYTRIFRFGHDLLVPTSIGGIPPKLFLLDTGSFQNSISPAAAKEVTHVDESDVVITGVSGGVKNVYSAHKAVLQFGRLKQENQEMTAFDTARISDGVGTEVSGFLGFVMLRFLDIKIDYRDALVDFNYDPKFWNMQQ